MTSRLFLLLFTFFSLTSDSTAQLTPEQALKTFTVAEGLQLELFAAEPLFANPTSMDIDHKGRVWVCEAVNYRCHLFKKPLNRKEGDRIVILEDTNGDGKADKATTFYQAPDFVAPLGICIAPYPDGKGVKVYVCHSPHIYVFEDKDGDGKADGPPKILLTGFNGFDHDHGVHGIHFGPDGKLYFSVGDQGVRNLSSSNGDIKPDKETRRGGDKEKKWTTNRTDCQAGTVWRCNPDGTGLELLAHNFRNPYEPAVNSFGTMFMSDNDDDGNQQTRICHVMYGGNYGYWPRGKGESHWHEEQPGVVHKALRTGFGSPTGLCWYEGTLLPKKYHGQLLHTDAGPRHVRCYHVKPKGAGYELEQEILVSSTDNWFRPVDVCVAPDGSVFIADWYDPGVGGHGMGDKTRGRIYRLVPKGHQGKGYDLSRLNVQKADDLVAALHSPNLATRRLAHLAAAQLTDIRQMERYCELIVGQREPAQLARALWEMSSFWLTVKRQFEAGRLPVPDLNFAEQAYQQLRAMNLMSTDPQARLASCRRFCETTGPVFPYPAPKLMPDEKPLNNNISPDICRELLLYAYKLSPAEAANLIRPIMQHYDGQDHFYLAALNIAVGTDPKRREIILADFEKHFPEWNDKTAKLVWELRPPQVISKLDKKLSDPKLTAAQKGFILEILAASEGDAPGKVLLSLLRDNPSSELSQQAVKSLVRFLPGKWNCLAQSDDFRAVIDGLLSDTKSATTGLQLVAAARYTLAIDQVAKLARAHDLEAIRTLGTLADYAAVVQLQNVLGAVKVQMRSRRDGKAGDTLVVGVVVIRALGMQSGNGETAAAQQALTILKQVLKSPDDPLELRQAALLALAGSRTGSQWLLYAKTKDELPEALLPEAARLLRNSPYQPIRNRALIDFPTPGKLDLTKLPSLATLAKRRGNSDRGKSLVFTHKDVACTRCHTIQGYGGQIGPDLSTIGVKGSRENLFESILAPDKAIADQYVQLNVETDKGGLLTGLVIEETKEHILLRDANGKDTKIPQKEIVQRAKNVRSIMPSDLAGYLTEEDLVDIIEYLTTLKQPALSVDQWQIAGPIDGPMDKPLNVDLFQTPGLEGKGQPWRTIKPDGTGYVDLRAHYAPHSDNIISYVACEIESPLDQAGTILLGTDDEARLWLNGAEIFAHKRHDAATPHRDRVAVALKKGKNRLLLKINNGDGPHGFYFTLLSKEPLKVVR